VSRNKKAVLRSFSVGGLLTERKLWLAGLILSSSQYSIVGSFLYRWCHHVVRFQRHSCRVRSVDHSKAE